MWEVSTGKLLHTLNGHTNETLCVAWSPGGKLLASGSRDKTICLWDTASWTLWRQLVGHGELIDNLEWSADGSRLLSDSYSYDSYGSPLGKLCVWDVLDGRLLETLRERKRDKFYPRSVTHGRLRAAISPQSALRLYAAESDIFLRNLSGPGVWKVAWSPDESLLAVRLDGGAVQIWDTATAQLLRTVDEDSTIGVGLLAWSPDGKRLATSHVINSVSKVWETASGKLLHTLKGHESTLLAIAWSADGSKLATGASDLTVRLWDAVTRKLVWSASTSKGSADDYRYVVGDIHWATDGKRVMSLSGSGILCDWDVSNGALLRTLNEANNITMRNVAWSASGGLVAASDWKKGVRLWETVSGKLLREWECLADNVESVAFSPDEKFVVAGCRNGAIIVWAVETGAEWKTFATDLNGYELKNVEFVLAASVKQEFGQTPYGVPELVVNQFAL